MPATSAMLTLTHHGAVTGVTGSCHELTLHGPGGAKSGILVDCGLFQGDEAAGRADRLILESTYGDRDHEDRTTRRHRLKAVLEHALADGGTVLIPAFAIGRTQELLYEIEDLIWEAGDDPAWQQLDIVVDSPLAAEFTRLYRQLKRYWDEEATARLRRGRHPLSFDQLLVINSHADHLKAVDYLARSGRPCVVIAGSGMCAGGRVVNYLRAMLGDARNDVLFVGYQAAGTPGRDILTHGPRGGWVMLDGERHAIRAQIHQVGGYSAHAGQSDLLRFVAGIPQMPAEVRIVHGDDDAKAALKRKLDEAGAGNSLIPNATGRQGRSGGSRDQLPAAPPSSPITRSTKPCAPKSNPCARRSSKRKARAYDHQLARKKQL